jgi:hypothetical protein
MSYYTEAPRSVTSQPSRGMNVMSNVPTGPTQGPQYPHDSHNRHRYGSSGQTTEFYTSAQPSPTPHRVPTTTVASQSIPASRGNNDAQQWRSRSVQDFDTYQQQEQSHVFPTARVSPSIPASRGNNDAQPWTSRLVQGFDTYQQQEQSHVFPTARVSPSMPANRGNNDSQPRISRLGQGFDSYPQSRQSRQTSKLTCMRSGCQSSPREGSLFCANHNPLQ